MALEESSTGGEGPVLFRLFAMVVIFCIKVSFGSAPLYFRTNVRFLSLANAFAGGVFLAGGLTHLLPEAVEAFAKLGQGHADGHDHGHDHEHAHIDIPVRPFELCALGFLCTFYLEKILMAPGQGKKQDELPTSHAHPEEPSPHGHSHAHETQAIFNYAAAPDAKSVMPLVLTAVLSIHSIVSGMALGIQEDPAKAMLIFLAIVSHKWVEAFSLGTNIVRATEGKIPVMVRLLSVFALSSPLGVAIGWALNASLTGTNAAQATAFLDAAAAGTFVYISVVDTLAEEFSNGCDLHRKFLSVVSGFALMRFLGGLVAHHH